MSRRRGEKAAAFVRASIVAMLTAAIGGPLWGQSGTSSALAGEVADRSGAAIANAAVKATEVNTGAARAFAAVRAKRREAPSAERCALRAAGFMARVNACPSEVGVVLGWLGLGKSEVREPIGAGVCGGANKTKRGVPFGRAVCAARGFFLGLRPRLGYVGPSALECRCVPV